jgi:hypothetical protein
MTDLGVIGSMFLCIIVLMIWFSNAQADKTVSRYMKRDFLFLAILFFSIGYVYPAVCWLTK